MTRPHHGVHPHRRGIQPLVELSVEGSRERSEAGVGDEIEFSVDARVPPGTGKIVKVEWDFEGTGTYPTATATKNPMVKNLKATHTFTEPGTYFAVVRVTVQRESDTNDPFTRVQNLDRVRVVVH